MRVYVHILTYITYVYIMYIYIYIYFYYALRASIHAWACMHPCMHAHASICMMMTVLVMLVGCSGLARLMGYRIARATPDPSHCASEHRRVIRYIHRLYKYQLTNARGSIQLQHGNQLSCATRNCHVPVHITYTCVYACVDMSTYTYI